ncbi:MAG: protein of unknown function DUF433 [Candidatus Rifleibacterium amylolyticum]|nr:MAG: protein of unknown function DUF433 [Candidatus Rifleibacterium amylolyticum]
MYAIGMQLFTSSMQSWFWGMIVCDPDIMMGKPVISGTRITVELILEKLADGKSYDDLITAHPQLTHQSIAVVLKYAAENFCPLIT